MEQSSDYEGGGGWRRMVIHFHLPKLIESFEIVLPNTGHVLLAGCPSDCGLELRENVVLYSRSPRSLYQAALVNAVSVPLHWQLSFR